MNQSNSLHLFQMFDLRVSGKAECVNHSTVGSFSSVSDTAILVLDVTQQFCHHASFIFNT
jgi:hypothetical protein